METTPYHRRENAQQVDPFFKRATIIQLTKYYRFPAYIGDTYKATCLTCGRDLASSRRAASNLVAHLSSVHKDQHAEFRRNTDWKPESQTKVSRSAAVNMNQSNMFDLNLNAAYNRSTVKPVPLTQRKLTDCLMKLITRNPLPPSLVQTREFRNLMELADPNYQNQHKPIYEMSRRSVGHGLSKEVSIQTGDPQIPGNIAGSQPNMSAASILATSGAGTSAAGTSAAGMTTAAGMSSAGMSSAGMSSAGISTAVMSATGMSPTRMSSAAGISAAGTSAAGMSATRMSSAGGMSVGGISAGGISAGSISAAGTSAAGMSAARMSGESATWNIMYSSESDMRIEHVGESGDKERQDGMSRRREFIEDGTEENADFDIMNSREYTPSYPAQSQSQNSQSDIRIKDEFSLNSGMQATIEDNTDLDMMMSPPRENGTDKHGGDLESTDDSSSSDDELDMLKAMMYTFLADVMKKKSKKRRKRKDRKRVKKERRDTLKRGMELLQEDLEIPQPAKKKTRVEPTNQSERDYSPHSDLAPVGRLESVDDAVKFYDAVENLTSKGMSRARALKCLGKQLNSFNNVKYIGILNALQPETLLKLAGQFNGSLGELNALCSQHLPPDADNTMTFLDQKRGRVMRPSYEPSIPSQSYEHENPLNPHLGGASNAQ